MTRIDESAPGKMVFLSCAVTQGDAGVLGGGEHFAIELLRELRRRGWSITLVCPAASPLTEGALSGSVEVVTHVDLDVKIRQPFRFVATFFRWLWFVRTTRAGLIYGNGYEALKWLAFARLATKSALICHLHESSYADYRAPRSRRLAPFVDRFFAISQAVLEEFHEGAKAPLEKIALVPNGVPISAAIVKDEIAVRAEFGLAKDVPLIVMVARTDPLKGHAVLLRAIPAVLRRHPDACFVFVGISRHSPEQDEMCREWLEIIERLGIGPSVRLEPYRADARRLMNAADLVIVPSTAEGFGRTAIEAMAEETAVIVSKVGGLAEIVTSDVNGLTFPSGDSDALAEAMNRLLDDSDARRRLAKRGRQDAVELYSTAAMVDRIEGELVTARAAASAER